MVKYLIEKHNVTDYDTGLINACTFCNAEVAELLVKKDSPILNAALGYACENDCGKPRIYEVLTLAGATHCDWCGYSSEKHVLKDE